MGIMINRERLLQTLTELCSIPSPSGREEPVAAYIRRSLEELEIPVEEDKTGNLYARIPSDHSEFLFLSSHMDTVPVEGEITVIRKDGRIRSDGTTILGGDDKQGVAAALEMARLCREHPGTHRGLELIFTVEEEIGSRGGAGVEASRLKACTGFNLDGETAPGTVIRKAPHKEKFICRVEGRSSHAALEPEDGINAILLASRIIAALPLGVPGPVSTSNVGIISGGKQVNVVPGLAEFEGELRSFSPDEFEEIRSRMEKICRETAEQGGGRAALEWQLCYKAYELAEDEPCALWFKEACRQQNMDPVFVSSRGGGDSNQLNNLGLRNLVFGLGMHNIHSVDEYLEEDEYCRGVELLSKTVFPGE